MHDVLRRVIPVLCVMFQAGAVVRGQCGEWGGAPGSPADLHDDVRVLTMWDPDGAGPLGAQVVAGGDFVTANFATVNRLARWDGAAWQGFGAGMNGSVRALTTWDPDGTGPLAAQLIAGGTFSTAGGTTVNSIARWDPGAPGWQSFGDGMSGIVTALTTWDPDGSGPLGAQVIAGGTFITAGGSVVNRIARWDPGAPGWQSLGSGMNGIVSALVTWDPDGSGPLGVQVVAGGNFTTAGGVTVNRVARWDGTAWQSFGAGVNNMVRALTTWDPDGDGPQGVNVVAGGEFTTAGGLTVNFIARWSGATWHLLHSGMNNIVYALTTWDPDGAGPLASQLVAGGAFTTAAGLSANSIARWNGSLWQTYGIGMESAVYALTTWDPDDSGSQDAQLVAGGGFTLAGGYAAGHLATWSTLQPEITVQPWGDAVAFGNDVLFTVAARNGQPTYRWRRAGLNLVDGPTGHGSTIFGAMTPELLITDVQASDAGVYDCLITNSCGGVTSDGATVVVAPPHCAGDANHDNIIDGSDLSVLLSQFGDAVAPGAGADLNGDGVVDGNDLSVLLGAFGSGC